LWLIESCITKIKEFLGPVTRVKKEKFRVWGPRKRLLGTLLNRNWVLSFGVSRETVGIHRVPFASRLPFRSAAHRDKSREWNDSKQKWNLC